MKEEKVSKQELKTPGYKAILFNSIKSEYGSCFLKFKMRGMSAALSDFAES